MKVQFELVIGQSKYTLIEDVESNTDFFKKLHFYSTLPRVGPNGETDLVLRYRVAQKQYEYFSIVSEKAGMEFKFGQPKEAKGELFPKGWEPLYKADGEEEAGNGASQANSTGGLGGLGAPQQAPSAAPAAGTSVGMGGLGATAAPRTPTPAPAAATPSTPTPAPAASAPQAAAAPVQAQANNILAKFGLS
jgi:hypothetical protein